MLKHLMMADSVSSGILMQIYPMIQWDLCETWYHSSCDVLNECDADHRGPPGLTSSQFLSVLTLIVL